MFSATASLTAAAFLVGVGKVTLRKVERRAELPFAAIPFLFAVQQLTEGLLWLGFSWQTVELNFVLTQLYSFFHTFSGQCTSQLPFGCWSPRLPTQFIVDGVHGWSGRRPVSVVHLVCLPHPRSSFCKPYRVRLPALLHWSGNGGLPFRDDREHAVIQSPNGEILWFIGAHCGGVGVSFLRPLVYFGLVLLRCAHKYLCLPVFRRA